MCPQLSYSPEEIMFALKDVHQLNINLHLITEKLWHFAGFVWKWPTFVFLFEFNWTVCQDGNWSADEENFWEFSTQPKLLVPLSVWKDIDEITWNEQNNYKNVLKIKQWKSNFAIKFCTRINIKSTTSPSMFICIYSLKRNLE